MTLSTHIAPFVGRSSDAELGLEVPRPMAGAIIHLDARHGITVADGALVETWEARAGTSMSATSSGDARPTYRATGMNGFPGLEFAAGDFLDLGAAGRAATKALPGLTIFAVGYTTAVTDATQAVVHFSNGTSSATSRATLRVRNTVAAMSVAVRRTDAEAAAITAGLTSTTAAHIASAVINYQAGTAIGNLNGTNSTQATLTSSGVSENTDSLAAVIGVNNATGTVNRFDGLISFVAVFPFALSPLRQQRVRRYLGRAFNITTT